MPALTTIGSVFVAGESETDAGEPGVITQTLVPVSPLALAYIVTVPLRIPVSRPLELIYPLPSVSSTVHVNVAPGTSFPFTSR